MVKISFDIYKCGKAPQLILTLINVVACFLLVRYVLDARQFPYADDWAYVAALTIDSPKELMQWFFAQHVDHRIPIQKSIQYCLTRLFDFDFRVLILFNVFVAFITAQILLSSARVYRGYQHYGDVVIPLIIMSPAAVYSIWGFQLQFLSSVFFVALSTYYACNYSLTGRLRDKFFVIVGLFFCALCGVNGLIFSSFLVVGIAFYIVKNRKSNRDCYAISMMTILLAALNVFIWLMWSPSASSGGEFNFFSVLEIFLKLLPSSMAVFALSKTYWKICFIVFAILFVGYVVAINQKNEKFKFSDLFLVFSLLASLLVVLSIAIGRGKFQGGWNNTLLFHYGFLTVLIPIIVWIFISKRLDRKVLFFISAVVCFIFAYAYYDNYVWRMNYMASVYDSNRLVNNSLKDETDVNKLVDKHVLDFTWKDDRAAKQPVIEGILSLRAKSYPIYKTVTALPFSLTPLETGQIDKINDSMLIGADQVVEINGWIESGDFDRTAHGNFTVYGSYRTSDSDLGKIKIFRRQGQYILFKSGPNTKYQRIEFNHGGGVNSFSLPVSIGWNRLEFDAARLPAEFSFTIYDEGATWGEWSAVAVRRR